KRRIMLDFLLASALADKTKLSQIVVSNFIWKVPGAFELKRLDEFYNEIEAHSTEIKKIEVTHHLTHGKFGAMHGIQTNDNGMKIDRKSTRLNSSHVSISYAVFCSNKTTCRKPSH